MPASMRVAARLFDTVKLSAPASEARWSEKPVSAKAATLITSNQTNRLNRSRVRQKPCMAARNSSISTAKVLCTSSKRPQAKTSVAANRSAMKPAKPALAGSAAKAMPSVTPGRGVQPPNQ